jgi:hypothetical protein
MSATDNQQGPGTLHRPDMTEADEVLLDVWTQFAHPRQPRGYWAGGLSTLEAVEQYLRGRRLIDEDGTPHTRASRIREERLAEQVPVIIFYHPSWDMRLILEASEGARDQAIENLAEGEDAELLTAHPSILTRRELYDLPEWDG